jgi:hypothetical protein
LTFFCAMIPATVVFGESLAGCTYMSCVSCTLGWFSVEIFTLCFAESRAPLRHFNIPPTVCTKSVNLP